MPAVEWLPWWSSRTLHIWDLWLWHFAWDIDIEKNWPSFNIKSLVKVNIYTNVKGTNVIKSHPPVCTNICQQLCISNIYLVPHDQLWQTSLIGTFAMLISLSYTGNKLHIDRRFHPKTTRTSNYSIFIFIFFKAFTVLQRYSICFSNEARQKGGNSET